ncbi:MAG: TraR/DksA family transcriptional regulator [Aureispira sp.]|nr:TraR/DksA family transcriptional regulator [Aureispira sp.]
MDDKQREEIKKLIQKKILQAEKKVTLYQEMAQPITPENSIGRVSRMDAINNKGVLEAALRKAEGRLSALRSMVNKVDDEDFGKCSKCKIEIPVGRVLLMPESPYCVNCAR